MELSWVSGHVEQSSHFNLSFFHEFSASRRLRINPDNIATPIAASLGDLVTLALLAHSAQTLHHIPNAALKIICPLAALAVYFCLILPICLAWAKASPWTQDLVQNGWTPVLSAMLISSLGGTILNRSIVQFPTIASYQPVINGVAGNLLGVQASRLSTQLHQDKKDMRTGEDNLETLLLSLVVPGHLMFNLLLSLLQNSKNF